MQIGCTRDFALREHRGRSGRCRTDPSPRARWLASKIPVYPKEIGKSELARKAGISIKELTALIRTIENSYPLCEDDGKLSLLSRRRLYVD